MTARVSNGNFHAWWVQFYNSNKATPDIAMFGSEMIEMQVFWAKIELILRFLD